jgi:hypothetical protein
VGGEQLKTAPRGYDPAHREITLLQLKQIIVVHGFRDEEVLAGDFIAKAVISCRVMRPFLDILNGFV